MVTEITPENLPSVQKGKAILDFWAPWCGPCRMFAPTFDEASTDHPDITFAKVNTDEPVNMGLASQYGIRGIPTIVFLKDGKEVGRFSGAYPKEMFEKEIKKHFG
jgi:thioredoxin 1